MPRATLSCWWAGLHVGELHRYRPWDLRLALSDDALARWPTNTPAISCSLPVQRRRQDASYFLRGLLPEGQHLAALAQLAGVATNDTYGLLARYGREVAGALVITDGEPPDEAAWGIEPYGDGALEGEVLGLTDGALGVHPDSELSIAGMQNKLLLVAMEDGGWGRPLRGRPSTHILKRDDDRHRGLVRAEADCLRLAAAVGLADDAPEIFEAEDVACIIVRRYDRLQGPSGDVDRLHQEDACQALDVNQDAARGRGKYEAHGGPTYAQVADLLERHATEPDVERRRLLELAVFTALIGNADAHGKNISLLHPMDGSVALAPAYDTVPTMLWPTLRRTAAMSVDGALDFEAMEVATYRREAMRWGLDGDEAAHVVRTIAGRVADAAPAVVERTDLRDEVVRKAERLSATSVG
jgi:serine/threonine-protein kinase HipA